MAILEFKEIPQANLATGKQDRFELFSRDFLKFLGYKILSDPDRGADGGKDLIVQEIRTGLGGETSVNWLVSCKHQAHSGKSVTPSIEVNIRDRVEANNCNGFIGFYSTLPSSGLSTNLEGLKDKIEVQTYDNEKIESQLLTSSLGIQLAERYFPSSIKEWKLETPQPAKIFSEEPSITCEYCNKQLLESEAKGNIIIWEDYKRKEEEGSQRAFYERIYCCCKGYCDKQLRAKIRQEGWMDKWEDLSDIAIPTGYIKWVMSTMNGIYAGDQYSEEAYEQMKHFILNIYPYISRHLTSSEKDRMKDLFMIPGFLGGFG